MATIIISIILLAVVVLIVRYLVKQKSTCPGCSSCNVESCPAHMNYKK